MTSVLIAFNPVWSLGFWCSTILTCKLRPCLAITFPSVLLLSPGVCESRKPISLKDNHSGRETGGLLLCV